MYFLELCERKSGITLKGEWSWPLPRGYVWVPSEAAPHSRHRLPLYYKQAVIYIYIYIYRVNNKIFNIYIKCHFNNYTLENQSLC